MAAQTPEEKKIKAITKALVGHGVEEVELKGMSLEDLEAKLAETKAEVLDGVEAGQVEEKAPKAKALPELIPGEGEWVMKQDESSIRLYNEFGQAMSPITKEGTEQARALHKTFAGIRSKLAGRNKKK